MDAAVQKTDVYELFDPVTAQHVYYVTGFFCTAGEKEAGRRTKKNRVGECIKALDAHFAPGREEERVREIKSDLPDGVTRLVDERCSMGGLKYPNAKLFDVFAIMEKVYSTTTTPENFTLYGGALLVGICSGILANETIQGLFFALYSDGAKFTEDEKKRSMQYYVKVFANVRAKDLCRRYNSNITKGATVGLRPTLAAGGKPNSKKKQPAKKRKRSTAKQQQPAENEDRVAKERRRLTSLTIPPLKDLLRQAGLPVSGNKDVLINRLMERFQQQEQQRLAQTGTGGDVVVAAVAPTVAAANGEDEQRERADHSNRIAETAAADDSDSDSGAEEELSNAEMHQLLQSIAEEDLDEDEDYLKHCSELPNEDEHMGQSVF